MVNSSAEATPRAVPRKLFDQLELDPINPDTFKIQLGLHRSRSLVRPQLCFSVSLYLAPQPGPVTYRKRFKIKEDITKPNWWSTALETLQPITWTSQDFITLSQKRTYFIEVGIRSMIIAPVRK